jgi:hypothetical protein
MQRFREFLQKLPIFLIKFAKPAFYRGKYFKILIKLMLKSPFFENMGGMFQEIYSPKKALKQLKHSVNRMTWDGRIIGTTPAAKTG